MSEFLIYQSEDGRTKLDVRLEDQTVWLSQKQFTELFGKAKGTISDVGVRRSMFDVRLSLLRPSP